MLTRRQKEHAAKMRARRGIRPWDHRHVDDAETYIVRLRRLFKIGWSDARISDALDMDLHLVSVLRTARSKTSPQSNPPVAISKVSGDQPDGDHRRKR